MYDKILENPAAIERLEYFLRPLFCQEMEKSYNLNKAFQLQHPVQKNKGEDAQETLDFDVGAWEEEQEQVRRERLKLYENSLSYLLSMAMTRGEISLKELSVVVILDGRQQELLPNIEVFKEIMVELIRNKEIDIKALQKEQSEYIGEQTAEFQLNVMLLYLVENNPQFEDILRIETYRLEDGNVVSFPGVLNENGERKTIRCSNILIRVIKEGQ